MEQKKSKQADPVLLLAIGTGALFVVNMLLFFFVKNETNTLQLLRSELVVLNQDKNIIASAQELTSAYNDEIEVISSVFPNEKTIANFLSVLEEELLLVGEGNTIKFGSPSPIPEGDKLFLLFTISMKATVEQLEQFLLALEDLPYLTHVTHITMKSDGINAVGDIAISLKVYVQNPFSTQ